MAENSRPTFLCVQPAHYATTPSPAGPGCHATPVAFRSTWTFNGKHAEARLNRNTGDLNITLPGRGVASGSLCVTIADGTSAGRSVTPAACPTLQALCGGGACQTMMKLKAVDGQVPGACCSEVTVPLTNPSSNSAPHGAGGHPWGVP